MKPSKAILATALLTLSVCASAQRKFADWTVTPTDSDTVIASTLNDSGQWFGKVCWVSLQKCVWALSVADTCKDGDIYIGLVNSNSGAQEMKFVCSGNIKEGQILVMQDYEKMSGISANDPAIGIAMPMQNGAFKVVRFTLNGSHEATQAAESVVMTAASKSTRDITL